MQIPQSIRQPQQIRDLKRYVPRISDLASVKRVLRHYDLRPLEIACALCGNTHMDGRIVELETGEVSNIGHICGKGLKNYEEADRSYIDSLNRPRLLAKLKEGIDVVDSLTLRGDAIRNRLSVLESRSLTFHSFFPQLSEQLRKRALEKRARVEESILRQESEIEDLLAANPFQSREALRVKAVHQGDLVGLELFELDFSGDSNVMALFRQATEFRALSFGKLSASQLGQWVAWLREYTGSLEKLEKQAHAAQRFFSNECMRLLRFVVAVPTEKSRLSAFSLRDLEPAPPKRDSPPENMRLAYPTGVVRSAEPRKASAKELRRLTGDKRAR